MCLERSERNGYNYETPDGKESIISITFGHSKQKREDKKQIKMGLGVANGVIVDAKVLSGNKDDKTYYGETLEEVEQVFKRLNIPVGDFHYIADSALFTSDNFKKAEGRSLKLITRMPKSTNLAKECMHETLINKDLMKKIEIKTAQGKVVEYFISEKYSTFENTKLKCAICYSTALEGIRKKTIERQVKKEKQVVEKLSKSYSKRAFSCEEDAKKEILKLLKKDF